MANKELLIKIAADSKEAVAAMKRLDQSAQQSAGVMGKLDTAMKGAIAAFSAQAVLDFAGDTLRAASDLQESTNAIRVTFGAAADKVLEFGESAAESAGLASSEFNNLVVPIGAMLQNFGLSADEAADKSIELAQRAADMASVFNVDVSEALGAIQAGLRGEADPLERFGVGLNAAAVEAYALENGLAATKAGIDDNIKVQARLGLLMEQTNRVAGDFANTSDGLANQQRIAAAEAENLKAEIGEELQPAATAALQTFRELAPSLADTAKELASVVSSLGPLLNAMGAVSGQIDKFKELAETDTLLGSFADSALDAANPVRGLSGAIEELKALFAETETEQDALADSTKNVADKTDSYRDAAERMKGRLGELEGAVKITKQEFEGYSRSIRDVITAQAEAADPALALINANIRLAEAEDKVAEAVRKHGANSEEARDAQLDLLAATGDLDGALGTFRQEGGAQSIEALRALAERAGLSEEAIQNLIDEIKQLNNTPVKGITENADGTYSVGTIKAFDTGGVVPGPRGAAQLAVVHGGETILPTHKGAVTVGGMSAPSSGGSTPIVIQLDGTTLMTALVPHFERYANRTGRTVIRGS